MAVNFIDAGQFYACLSTDTKPTKPSEYLLYEIDTGLCFAWNETTWVAYLDPSDARFFVSSDSFVAIAAGDYADNDVLSDGATNGTGTALEFTNAVKFNGGMGKIIGGSINVVASTNVAATIGLQLFSATPTATELDDNAAEGGVGAADAPNYLGEMLFAAGTDYGAGNIKPPSAVTPAAPLFIRTAAASRSIFGRLIFRDAETSETASMPVHVTLYIEG